MPLVFGNGQTILIVPPVLPTIRAAPPNTTQVVVPVIGPPGPPGTPGGGGYRHVQTGAAETWTIPHGLGYHPAGLVITDSAGDILEPAQVLYPDLNNMQVTFPGRPASGVANVS